VAAVRSSPLSEAKASAWPAACSRSGRDGPRRLTSEALSGFLRPLQRPLGGRCLPRQRGPLWPPVRTYTQTRPGARIRGGNPWRRLRNLRRLGLRPLNTDDGLIKHATGGVTLWPRDECPTGSILPTPSKTRPISYSSSPLLGSTNGFARLPEEAERRRPILRSRT
jgi:hypothetical protein